MPLEFLKSLMFPQWSTPPWIIPQIFPNIQLSRVLQILNVFATFLSNERVQITDPTSLLPDGFMPKPNIRQGKAGLRSSSDVTSNFMPPPEVTIDLGSIEGYFMRVISGRKVYAFEGIPYAEPPIQTNRFKPPLPKLKWNGTLSAKKWGAKCTQTRPRIGGIFGNEDCLFLNVYSPEIPNKGSNPSYPVIIFIHGGAWGVGSSTEYGASYLMSQDIILVTINYRLGIFGFLSTGDANCPGNMGLKDQSLAIDWVHKNIKSFGGNPKRILVMGQSAGGVSAHLHMMSKLSRDKIFAVMALSGTAFNPWGLRLPIEDRRLSRRMASLNRCPTDKGTEIMMDCLRTISSTNLTLTANFLLLAERKVFMPVIEPEGPGAFITKTPTELYARGEVPPIPLICSMTSKELEISLAFKLAGVDFFPFIEPPLYIFGPMLLDYHGKVKNEFETTRNIIKHYGGDEIIRSDPSVLAQMATDRHFSLGIKKAIQVHAKIAPTYAYYFKYSNNLGFASDLGLNPSDFGVPHGEDMIFFFNRTDRKPIRRTQGDFAVVKLLQNLVINFATTGVPLYTSEEDNYEDFKIWEPVKTSSSHPITFLQIDHDVKMMDIPEFENATSFWESLHITELAG